MVSSASSWLDGWLVIKGAFTNSHGPAWSSNPAACRGFYISPEQAPLVFHSYEEYRHISDGARTMPARNR